MAANGFDGQRYAAKASKRSSYMWRLGAAEAGCGRGEVRYEMCTRPHYAATQLLRIHHARQPAEGADGNGFTWIRNGDAVLLEFNSRIAATPKVD